MVPALSVVQRNIPVTKLADYVISNSLPCCRDISTETHELYMDGIAGFVKYDSRTSFNIISLMILDS